MCLMAPLAIFAFIVIATIILLCIVLAYAPSIIIAVALVWLSYSLFFKKYIDEIDKDEDDDEYY